MKNISDFRIECNATSDLKIVNQVMVGQLRNDSCLLEVKFQGRQSLIAAVLGTQLGEEEEEEEMCISGNF